MCGMAALLRKEMLWLVAVYCLNHRLELGVKDALSKTYMNELSTMLINLYYAYKKSPKQSRELKCCRSQALMSLRKCMALGGYSISLGLFKRFYMGSM